MRPVGQTNLRKHVENKNNVKNTRFSIYNLEHMKRTVFGCDRSIVQSLHTSSSTGSWMPAAMDMTKASSERCGSISRSTEGRMSGFTASITTSDPAATCMHQGRNKHHDSTKGASVGAAEAREGDEEGGKGEAGVNGGGHGRRLRGSGGGGGRKPTPWRQWLVSSMPYTA